MKALSYKQPWALLVALGIKPIENRTWKCPENYIGQRILIHASKTPDKINLDIEGQATVKEIQLLSALNRADEDDLYGCIIGSVEIIDCVINHENGWAEKTSPSYCTKCSCENWSVINKHKDCATCNDLIKVKPVYNWVLANPILFPEPIPAKGKLSFWEYEKINSELDDDGTKICTCQIGVKEESQVMVLGGGSYECRYCGGKWYK